MSVSIDKKNFSIPDAYSGKTIFITGGSGFIGKVLIEKLLRSCPDIKNIFVLMRPKKNKNVQERVKALFDIPLFDKLKRENIKALDKVLGINGNVSELNLGLSEEDMNTLINTVSMIYHIAACVRFDDFLKSAILTNTRSTRDIIFLAKRVKSLDVFIHISTAYCHADQERIEEQSYPPKQNWREAIELAEKYDEETLQVLSQKYIHPMPNTYTFTKALAENVVMELCENQLPAVIMRPSIVASSASEPVVGWVDNFNGPAGLNIIGVKGLGRIWFSLQRPEEATVFVENCIGLMKLLLGDPAAIQDYVFVDNLVKSIAVAAWRKMVEPDPCRIEIYNVTDFKMSLSHFINMGKQIAQENPPDTYLTTMRDIVLLKNPTIFYFLTLIFHILPAIIFDVAALISGNKLRLMKIYRKTYIANLSLSKFMCRSFSIKSKNYGTMNRFLLESDEPAFEILYGGKSSLSEEAYQKAADMWSGCKKYLLKERAVANDADIKKYSRLMGINNVVVYTFQGFIYFMILWKMVFPWFTSTINNIVADES